MSWKDYFGYDRRDKNAIILLLILIMVSFLVYIHVDKHFARPADSKYELPDLKNFVNISKLEQGQTVDINLSDTLELKRVPGIGSSYANRIVKYRELLGGYVSIDQLKEVWGVDDSMYEKISPYFSISTGPDMLHVNKSEYGDLIRHPYLNKEQVRAILDLSRRKKNLTGIKRLSLLEEFTDDDIRRLSPYLSFD